MQLYKSQVSESKCLIELQVYRNGQTTQHVGEITILGN